MKVVFFSNFLVPHQLQFCIEMAKITNNNFTFVATEPFYKEGVTGGFEDLNSKYDFCLKSYESETNYKKAEELAKNADVFILGAAPEKFVRMRIKKNKITFKYNEREFKPNNNIKGNVFRMFKFIYAKHTIYKNKPVYLLCASAYAAKDFNSANAYINKVFKWGYFPKGSDKSYKELKAIKEMNGRLNILWAGRMIDWKHGEAALEIAKHLKDKKIDFELIMLGDGEKKQEWQNLANFYSLTNHVKFIDSIPNKEVIELMEKSDILLATSDENEGWGAVVNEAMSAGCVVIGSRDMGSVPYLINDDNGVIFDLNNIEEAKAAVETLSSNKELRLKLSENAKITIDTVWNAKVAAENVIELYKALQDKNKTMDIVFNGPCDRA